MSGRAALRRVACASNEAAPMHIDLLSPSSFAAGQPHEQYRWLRENDPVHWHEEPNGARLLGGDPLRGRLGRRPRLPDLLVRADHHDPRPAAAAGRRLRALQDDADDGPAASTRRFRKLIRSEFTLPVGAAARRAHRSAGAPDRRCGDREGRMRLRRRRRRRDAVLRHRRADGPAARRRARALQADRDHPHRAGGPGARRRRRRRSPRCSSTAAA